MKRDFLLFPERIALESLARGPKNFDELAKDIGISKYHLDKILALLMDAHFVNEENGKYHLMAGQFEHLNKNRTPIDKKLEIEEIFQAMLKLRLNENNKIKRDEAVNFAFKKVWMSKEEEIYFNAIMEKLNTFMTNVSTRTSSDEKTMNQRMVFWGHSDCLNIMNSYLNNI